MSQAMQRNEDRFRPAAPPVHIRARWDDQEHAGSLCDVSSRGVRIWLRANVPVGTEMELQVDADDAQLVAHPIARWSTPTPDGFMIGCQLRDPLPQKMLEELARKGCLERRSESRERTDIDVEVRVELDGGQRNVARMVDYSADGFRLHSSCEMPPGKRLLLEHEIEGSMLRIPARSVWQVEDEGSFIVGCCLLQPSGTTALERVVKAARAAVRS